MFRFDRNSLTGIITLFVFALCGATKVSGMSNTILFLFLYILGYTIVFGIFTFLLPGQVNRCEPNWFVFMPFSAALLLTSLIGWKIYLCFWIAGSATFIYDYFYKLKGQQKIDGGKVINVVIMFTAGFIIPVVLSVIGGILA